MLKQWAKAILLVAAAGAAQYYACGLAYEQRGYLGIGGEFFIFPVIVILGYHVLGLARYDRMRKEIGEDGIIRIDQYRRERKRRERKERRRAKRLRSYRGGI